MSYQGRERRKGRGRRAKDQIGADFERAVRTATEIATQNVAAIHRKRLVAQSFIAALAVMGMVAVILGVGFKSSSDALAHKEAAYNCRLVQGLTATMSLFVESDAQSRLQQARESLTPELVKDFAKIIPLRRLGELSARNVRQSVALAQFWRHQVEPRLSGLGRLDCARRLP